MTSPFAFGAYRSSTDKTPKRLQPGFKKSHYTGEASAARWKSLNFSNG
jgi:hypothetical protein